MVTINISQIYALSVLALFYVNTKEWLAPLAPLYKFGIIKMIIFVLFWQAVAMSIAGLLHLITPLWGFEDVETTAAGLQDFIVTARELKQTKVFRESTIRSLFDEILRGLRIVHQHKMLHLDIKPANIFITDDNKSVLIDFGAAREVLSKEGNFIRPMYTPGFAAPEMYKRDAAMVFTGRRHFLH